jgi:hypothetical protein
MSSHHHMLLSNTTMRTCAMERRSL